MRAHADATTLRRPLPHPRPRPAKPTWVLIVLSKRPNRGPQRPLRIPYNSRTNLGDPLQRFLSYLMRMSSGVSVEASIAAIVSRTHLAFMSISFGGKSFSSFSK